MAKALSDQIRDAVRSSELSDYRICQVTRIDRASMSKFLKGERGLSLAAIDELAELLGLEIVVRLKRTRKGE